MDIEQEERSHPIDYRAVWESDMQSLHRLLEPLIPNTIHRQVQQEQLHTDGNTFGFARHSYIAPGAKQKFLRRLSWARDQNNLSTELTKNKQFY